MPYSCKSRLTCKTSKLPSNSNNSKFRLLLLSELLRLLLLSELLRLLFGNKFRLLDRKLRMSIPKFSTPLSNKFSSKPLSST